MLLLCVCPLELKLHTGRELGVIPDICQGFGTVSGCSHSRGSLNIRGMSPRSQPLEPRAGCGWGPPTGAFLPPPYAVFPPKAGPGPQQRVKGKHPVPLEDPEQEGSIEEELGALSHPPAALDAENRGRRTRDPILLSLPGPLVMEGLADAALQDGECLPGPTDPSTLHLLERSLRPCWRRRDAESTLGSALWGRGAAALGVVVRGKPAPSLPPVESLRHLILWGLLPGHPAEAQASGEPEADRTPTPSLMSSASQPCDPGSPGPERDQPEQEDTALSSLEHLPPRARNSGIWESPELDRNPEEETSNTEAAGSYKVVRKGKSIGTSTGETDARFTEAEASLPNGALSGKACAQRLPDPGRRRRHTKASGSGSRGSKPVT